MSQEILTILEGLDNKIDGSIPPMRNPSFDELVGVEGLTYEVTIPSGNALEVIKRNTDYETIAQRSNIFNANGTIRILTTFFNFSFKIGPVTIQLTPIVNDVIFDPVTMVID